MQSPHGPTETDAQVADFASGIAGRRCQFGHGASPDYA